MGDTGEPLFRCNTTFEVRWRDLDPMGHVNNAVYFTYLEHGRIQYLSELGLLPDDPRGIGFILAEASCTYKSPLALAEKVTLWVRCSELGNSSFVFEYRMQGQDGRLAATARSVQVVYDYAAGRPQRIPDDWRARIVDYEPGLRSP